MLAKEKAFGLLVCKGLASLNIREDHLAAELGKALGVGRVEVEEELGLPLWTICDLVQRAAPHKGWLQHCKIWMRGL